jgi:hypothetical protein
MRKRELHFCLDDRIVTMSLTNSLVFCEKKKNDREGFNRTARDRQYRSIVTDKKEENS